ncbi:MAG: hypothetical protein U5L07_04940 [Desulfobacterales bacterium]|nr:hypothetical protein [Desulfobacterales bacterium]
MHQLKIKVEVFEEDDLYVALCPSLNVSSFGESIDEAKKALVEAVEIFIEECSEMGTLDEVFEESGFTSQLADALALIRPTRGEMRRCSIVGWISDSASTNEISASANPLTQSADPIIK